MSLHNRITSNEMTKLLVHANRSPWYKTNFLPSLPKAGHNTRLEGGTMRYRLTAIPNRVMAKTGTQTGVNALAGYVRGKSGKWYAYSIITKAGSSTVPQIDRVVREMYEQL